MIVRLMFENRAEMCLPCGIILEILGVKMYGAALLFDRAGDPWYNGENETAGERKDGTENYAGRSE